MTDAPEWLYLGKDKHGFWSNAAADMDARHYSSEARVQAAERAAYLRGLEDAAKVAEDLPQGVWHDEEGNAAGSRPATPREVAAAIRALAKEAGE